MSTLANKIDLGWTGCNIDTKRPTRRRALYSCSCGEQWEAPFYQRKGLSHIPLCKSCAKKKHNLSKSKIYKNYHGMLQRCYNKEATGYEHYGERGIEVCEDWKRNFISFYNWAIKNNYEDGLTIERINNNGNYEPSNCKYIKQSEQWINQRTRKNNGSGFVGVRYDKSRDKYLTSIIINQHEKYIGRYGTALEAAVKREDFIVINNLPHKRNFTKVEL